MMTRRTLNKAIAATLALCTFGMAAEEAPKPAIELGTPFSDNAILQREMEVPVWGWSKPGTEVTVKFAGQEKKAKSGDDGKWMLKLDALKASAEPAEMVVSENGGATRTLKNVLVGEVWMASGQSNMQWLASKADPRNIIKALEEKGEKPPIRECSVTNFFAAIHPIERAAGEWKDGDYGNYSAIAFAFAYKLYQELGVPIGIVNCSFSQTSIEAWTPRGGFAEGTDEYTKSVYQKILETDPTSPEHKAAWDKFYQELEGTIAENAELVKKDEKPKDIDAKPPGNLNGNRDATWLFNARLNPMIPYAIRGAIWNQGYANMGAGITYYANLHSMIRGWRELWDRPELPVYFHQFYCPGNGAATEESLPSIESTAEMRLGTWLARDIPNTAMASQIDVQGAIHYQGKAVPGQRLALQALKNQYGKDVIADGPMFKSYSVEGDKLTVEFEHAEGGLVVGETGSNSIGKQEGATGFTDPKVIPNGDDQVKLFYLAGEDRVWHRANAKIEGDKVTVTAPGVKSPKGVSYGTGGIGFRPNLYNKAMLPMTPFIHFDNKLVTSKDWPDNPIKISGVEPDPNAGGLLEQYAKMPLLSTQFRDNAVLQADKPVTFWGSAVNNEWAEKAPGEKAVHFSFNGIEKTIPVTPGMDEWKVTIPAMPASAEPKTLKVTFTIDGELAREHIAENIIIGDVWYVGAPAALPQIEATEKSSAPVRMMVRKAKGSESSSPRRFSVCVSTTPKNRFASLWEDADGFAAALGNKIGAKTGRPVGIIFMQSNTNKGAPDAQIKQWMSPECLGNAPSLKDDYEQLAAIRPGNPIFDANVRRYMGDWKKMWSEYVPAMIKTKSVPDGVPWGTYPSMAGKITTNASDTYNVLVHSFTPADLKGVIFICNKDMVAEDQGANFGEQFSALANCLKEGFGSEPELIYTMPSKELAPKVTTPEGIKGKATAIEIGDWESTDAIQKLIDTAASQ